MDTAMMAETIALTGHGEEIEAYLARPLGPGPFPGVVVIHHMPGYDRATKEIVRTFAVYGYTAVCPNLHYRYAPGAQGDRRRGRRHRGGRRARRPVHRRRAPRGAVPPRAADRERQGRRDRVLLRRAPGVRGRVQPRHRRGRRLLRRPRRRDARGPHARAPDLADRPHPRPPLPAARALRRRGRQPVTRADRADRGSAAGERQDLRVPHVRRTRGTRSSRSTGRNYRVEAAKEGWKLVWDFFGRHLG